MKQDCGCDHCPGEEDCNCTGDEWDMENPAVILCETHREAMYGRMADRHSDVD